MGNSTWVCFDCRQAMRRATYSREIVKCSRCGQPSRHLGYKVRLPEREAKNDWRQLETDLNEMAFHTRVQSTRNRVRWRHEIEKDIAKLKARPTNKGRIKAMRLLQKQLQALKD